MVLLKEPFLFPSTHLQRNFPMKKSFRQMLCGLSFFNICQKHHFMGHFFFIKGIQDSP
mgnify:CR=1 FL=1